MLIYKVFNAHLPRQEHDLRGGGTIISVGIGCEATELISFVIMAVALSAATRAIIVNVLPRPIGSATMPPRNSLGSFNWDVPDILFRNTLYHQLAHNFGQNDALIKGILSQLTCLGHVPEVC